MFRFLPTPINSFLRITYEIFPPPNLKCFQECFCIYLYRNVEMRISFTPNLFIDANDKFYYRACYQDWDKLLYFDCCGFRHLSLQYSAAGLLPYHVSFQFRHCLENYFYNTLKMSMIGLFIRLIFLVLYLNFIFRF